MQRNLWIKLGLIVVLAGLAVWISIPGGFSKTGIEKEPKLRKGLDLVGGTHLVYEADMSKIAPEDRDSALTSLNNVIDRRINALGVTEPIIQTRKFGDKYGVIIELPGIQNVEDALSLIGKTAQLVFQESQTGDYQNWQDTGLTGQHLKKADVQFDQQGNPEISIQFNSEGAKLFADITKRNLQKPLAIFLDEELISAPTVQSEITDGQARITGQFTIDEAKNLAIQLNAGALPVPIKIDEQRNVGATLGAESIEKSLFAGLIGLILVSLFMILYYKLPGVLAIFALAIYAFLVLAIFRISSLTPWPFTLTLAGVAGFILSIGMAVDANILIFERTKEELRQGKTLISAVDAGFARAWPSIRDSNISSLITCLILFWFGTGSVRGFALTLAIGILVSMFTAITVTRTFLQVVTITKIREKMNWFISGGKTVGKSI